MKKLIMSKSTCDTQFNLIINKQQRGVVLTSYISKSNSTDVNLKTWTYGTFYQ